MDQIGLKWTECDQTGPNRTEVDILEQNGPNRTEVDRMY